MVCANIACLRVYKNISENKINDVAVKYLYNINYLMMRVCFDSKHFAVSAGIIFRVYDSNHVRLFS